jgi:hypothetical protein
MKDMQLSIMLGVNLWLHVKDTYSDPHKSGFRIHDTLAYSKGAFVEFFRKSEVPEVSKQRQ